MNQLTVQQQRKQQIETVRTALERMKGQFKDALPAYITPDRLCRVAMTAVQQTPKLLECDRTSLYSAIMKSAQLGLEPDGILGQAYLIPFGGKVQFIPGYKGLIDLARRSGEVSNIIAKEVYENDEFSVDWSQEIPFVHKPCLSGERGEVIIFWALAKFKDGGFHWDYMTRGEVEKVRDGSQGKNNAVWNDHFVEMGKKTVIRRIAKFLPMSVQRAATFDALQEAGKKAEIDEYGDITIEGTAEEVQEKDPAQSNKLDNFSGEPAHPESQGESAIEKGEQAESAHDPVTGEILENEAEQPTQDNPAKAVTVFSLDNHDLSTGGGVKAASKELLAYLGTIPADTRVTVFLEVGGREVTDKLGDAGLGMEKRKYGGLGINL